MARRAVRQSEREYKNCQHGKQDATTGECKPCDAGYQGSLCQFKSDWCTKVDKKATMVDDKCVCSKDKDGTEMYSGARCTIGGGKDMSNAQVIFTGRKRRPIIGPHCMRCQQ